LLFDEVGLAYALEEEKRNHISMKEAVPTHAARNFDATYFESYFRATEQCVARPCFWSRAGTIWLVSKFSSFTACVFAMIARQSATSS
jgi:hypothetical protein